MTTTREEYIRVEVYRNWQSLIYRNYTVPPQLFVIILVIELLSVSSVVVVLIIEPLSWRQKRDDSNPRVLTTCAWRSYRPWIHLEWRQIAVPEAMRQSFPCDRHLLKLIDTYIDSLRRQGVDGQQHNVRPRNKQNIRDINSRCDWLTRLEERRHPKGGVLQSVWWSEKKMNVSRLLIEWRHGEENGTAKFLLYVENSKQHGICCRRNRQFHFPPYSSRLLANERMTTTYPVRTVLLVNTRGIDTMVA